MAKILKKFTDKHKQKLRGDSFALLLKIYNIVEQIFLIISLRNRIYF